jgi:hypothetical protein
MAYPPPILLVEDNPDDERLTITCGCAHLIH